MCVFFANTNVCSAKATVCHNSSNTALLDRTNKLINQIEVHSNAILAIQSSYIKLIDREVHCLLTAQEAWWSQF